MNSNDFKKEYVWPLILIFISVAVAITFVIVSSDRPLSDLENSMFQLFILTIGLTGSYFVGKTSAKQAGLDMVRPHARPAFRRLLSLYGSLGRLARTIQESRENDENHNFDSQATLDKLQAIVTEQIATADDALEDWRDIVPDDVEEIIRRQQKPKAGEKNDLSNTR